MTSNDTLAIEHETQRLMLERLGIWWTPGEPFYALVENEIRRLRAELHRVAEGRRGQHKRAERAEAEIKRLRAAIEAYLENDSQANWDALAAFEKPWKHAERG